jgi:hypothetical protein
MTRSNSSARRPTLTLSYCKLSNNVSAKESMQFGSWKRFLHARFRRIRSTTFTHSQSISPISNWWWRPLLVLLASSRKMFGTLWKRATRFREDVENILHLKKTSSNSWLTGLRRMPRTHTVINRTELLYCRETFGGAVTAGWVGFFTPP